MILTCPSCGTQYVVKDGAIPPQGRQVRCAACKHSWHQEPDEPTDLELGPEAEVDETPLEEVSAEEIAPDEAAIDQADTGDNGFAAATMIPPSSGPEAEERAYEEAAIDAAAADPAMDKPAGDLPPADYHAPPGPELQADDEFSPFAERDYVEPGGRGRLRLAILAVVLIAALAAAFWFLAPPQWKSRLGLAETVTPLQLSNPPQVELRELASGNQLLTVAGRVINPTAEAHPVPPIYAQLYDRGGKVIYTWTIAPPTPTLAAGASASFNSAEVNVPAGTEGVTISLGPPKA